MTETTTYHSRAAQEAQATNYGDRDYWDYLERSAREHHAYFARIGEPRRAVEMLTQSLSESLMGNDGA